ncbi:amidohydrolase family protein [Cohnella sp. WQ 127256]|nr:amidohydrolase family protein [Cohnella sp. WQ 127256]
MFGSDWPIFLLEASYDQVVNIVEQALPDSWGELEREQLFGGNAKEFYKL